MNPYKNINDEIYKNFEKLNEYQKQAILNEDKVVLVNANVGSGKTTVLLNKILYLNIIKKIPFNQMFVLTFTNKAAEEIKERFIQFKIKIDENSFKYFGTFHSVAKRILDESNFIEKIGYKKGFSIIGQEELEEFINSIIDEKKIKIKYQNKIIKRIEEYKKENILYGNMKYEDDIKKLYKIIQEEKINNNIMDFDDLINNCILLLKLNNEITCEYIIIDEFQDCNSSQLEMINLISNKKSNIFAVGDINQTIYSWRGSKLNIFKEFKELKNATELNLPINYRSTDTILEVAKLFMNNSSELKGIRDTGNLITIKNHYNEFNEAIYVADKIIELVKFGYKYKDICILYRKQSQSKSFENIFDKEKIPYEVSVKKSILDIPILYWFIKILKASVNEYNKKIIKDIIKDEKYGFIDKKSNLINLFEENSNDSNQIIKRDFLIKKIEEFKKLKINILEIYDYFEMNMFLKQNSFDYQENKEYIMKFLNKLEEYNKKNKKNTFANLQEYLNNSSLFGMQIIDEKLNMDKDMVKLMTLHSSKGLEFKYVFISGANEGRIPLIRRGKIDFDEEKRLFFVGITRAKDKLEISYHTSPEDYGVFPKASQFLEIIPKHLIEKNEEYEENADDFPFGDNLLNANEKIKNIKREIKEYNKKDKTENIRHKKYGNGEIISKEDGMITVKFDKYGEKTFIEGIEELENI